MYAEQIAYARKCFRVAAAFHGNDRAFFPWLYGIEKRIITIWGELDMDVADFISEWRDEGLREA